MNRQLCLKYKQTLFRINVVSASSTCVAQSHQHDQLRLFFPREGLSVLIPWGRTDSRCVLPGAPILSNGLIARMAYGGGWGQGMARACSYQIGRKTHRHCGQCAHCPLGGRASPQGPCHAPAVTIRGCQRLQEIPSL